MLVELVFSLECMCNNSICSFCSQSVCACVCVCVCVPACVLCVCMHACVCACLCMCVYGPRQLL